MSKNFEDVLKDLDKKIPPTLEELEKIEEEIKHFSAKEQIEVWLKIWYIYNPPYNPQIDSHDSK